MAISASLSPVLQLPDLSDQELAKVESIVRFSPRGISQKACGDGLLADPRVNTPSQSSGRGEPDTLEAQARALGDQVVVAVVVQNTRAGLVRTSGDHDVDRR